MAIKQIKKNGKVIGYKGGKYGKIFKVSVYGEEQAKSHATKQLKMVEK